MIEFAVHGFTQDLASSERLQDVALACKSLKRLELAKISLLSKHIPEILEATASHCRHLEFLILPRNLEKRSTVSGPSIDKVMTTLYAAMERWIRLEA
ncbi:uncharacterized protein PITG_16747 [Phytophthora infestans T30-4]|uniref:F-box protein n=1 Tax=Phytophthora infestans (strain T30-4) TaxID=403677 RepID=D0NVI8_PHYIT|nr:uncharacterized protein PITG_16747 [Phytophthora infestans T30-4]EEY66665.1 conserved hypothetical protein [Phytophthora infestans T30-4]|eukprot:XP_002896966.1 conserved hypothetical protein [Phytophthora infestans T30-4]